jgi:hypothetical protein
MLAVSRGKEGSITMNQRGCDHRACGCAVEGGERFCSEHCREQAARGEGGEHICSCGHLDCEDAGTRETEHEILEAFE